MLNDNRLVEDDSEEEDSDDDDGGHDRSITLKQFVSLSQHLDNLYLHDFSLPRHCAGILNNQTLYDRQQKIWIPTVVAGYDLFQRTPVNGYDNSWTSLFVGQKGSNSKIHVDRGATGFFMYLVSGRKRWVVAHPSETVFVYKSISGNAFVPDVLGMDKSPKANRFLKQRFPLLQRMEGMYEVIQEPGQLMYIPPNSPHAVENLQDSIGIALNLVPKDAFASHIHDQIHHDREFGQVELALKYWLFEETAEQPTASSSGGDPLYIMTFAEYKGQL